MTDPRLNQSRRFRPHPSFVRSTKSVFAARIVMQRVVSNYLNEAGLSLGIRANTAGASGPSKIATV